MNIITNAARSMTSKEIADLVEKRHDNVKRTIESLAASGVIESPHSEEISTATKPVTVYVFSGEQGKRDSIIVVAQLSPEFTARLVDRWRELEAGMQQLPNFTNPVEAARAWADAKEAEQKALAALEEAKPAVEFVQRYVERSALQNATQVAQTFGMSAVTMNKRLDEFGGVYNKAVKRGRAFCQEWIDKGLGEMKQTEQGYPQALFTTKGAARVHEIMTTEGVI